MPRYTFELETPTWNAPEGSDVYRLFIDGESNTLIFHDRESGVCTYADGSNTLKKEADALAEYLRPMDANRDSTVAENAACLWECALELIRADADSRTPKDWRGVLLARWRVHGVAQLRSEVTGHALNAERAFQIAKAHGYADSFDWDFVPVFMAQCVSWHTGELVTTWEDVAKRIGESS